MGNTTLIAVFGGVIGSLITIIVRAVVDEAAKKRESKRIIQKVYFENKLRAGERAINSWSSLQIHLNTLVHSLKTIGDIEGSNFKGILQLWNNTITKVEQLQSDLNSGGNTIYLYYDMDHLEQWNDDDTLSILNLLTEMGNLQERVEILNDIYNDKNNTVTEDLYLEEFQKLKVEAKSMFQSLSILFMKMESYYKSSIREIRAEIKSQI